MKVKKVPLIVSGSWQFVRFALISISAILFLNPKLFIAGSVFVVWPAAGSLVLFAAYLVAGFDSSRFAALRGILILGKVLEILPGLVLLILQGGALYFGLFRPVFDSVPFIDELSGFTAKTGIFFYYGLACVVLVDLIFFLILLSYRTVPESQESAPGENLPVLEITQIEED